MIVMFLSVKPSGPLSFLSSCHEWPFLQKRVVAFPVLGSTLISYMIAYNIPYSFLDGFVILVFESTQDAEYVHGWDSKPQGSIVERCVAARFQRSRVSSWSGSFLSLGYYKRGRSGVIGFGRTIRNHI